MSKSGFIVINVKGIKNQEDKKSQFFIPISFHSLLLFYNKTHKACFNKIKIENVYLVDIYYPDFELIRI